MAVPHKPAAGGDRISFIEDMTDLSAPRRGGLRSHRGEGGRTLKQLRAEASKAGVRGRSTMNKAGLEKALKAR